jgi:hypothetical protein
MIRCSTHTLVILLIVLCGAAACAMWLANPPAAPQRPSPETSNQAPAAIQPLAHAPSAPALRNAQAVAAHIIPDPRFTPGAIDSDVRQDNIDSTICVPGFTKTIRPPARYTGRLKREQLDDPARGYNDREMRDYEEDHDVPLEVGGNPTDPRNLWPEPLHGPWNAHTKDKLENRMHELVCAHQITLAEGQAAFIGDWRTAYEKYVAGW